MVMDKKEFKALWESDEMGGGITYGDIADCAKAWGLYNSPKTSPIDAVLHAVLKSAGTDDYMDYGPTGV